MSSLGSASLNLKKHGPFSSVGSGLKDTHSAALIRILRRLRDSFREVFLQGTHGTHCFSGPNMTKPNELPNLDSMLLKQKVNS